MMEEGQVPAALALDAGRDAAAGQWPILAARASCGLHHILRRRSHTGEPYRDNNGQKTMISGLNSLFRHLTFGGYLSFCSTPKVSSWHFQSLS